MNLQLTTSEEMPFSKSILCISKLLQTMDPTAKIKTSLPSFNTSHEPISIFFGDLSSNLTDCSLGYLMVNGLDVFKVAVWSKSLNSFPSFGAEIIMFCIHLKYEISKTP